MQLGYIQAAVQGQHLVARPLLALAIVSLAGATWGGLVRLGWSLPPLRSTLAAFHGPLMVCGFLGTVISLERAVALGLLWPYAAPLCTALGIVALVAGHGLAGAVLMTGGSVALLGVFLELLRRQPETFTRVMALGVAAWLAGNLLWLSGWPIFRVVPWWSGFVVLVIAGERQELTRLLSISRAASSAFWLACSVLLAGIAATIIAPAGGLRVAGAGMTALAIWLARYDMARSTVHRAGLSRFMAVCLLSGYVWLAVAGLLNLTLGAVAAGPHYDAVVHALFLGFVFSMIFGHAPVVFPTVLGLPVGFRGRFYAHVVSLHASLGLRLAGDLIPAPAARGWGGVLNAVTLLLFVANTLSSVGREKTPPQRRSSFGPKKASHAAEPASQLPEAQPR